jgi:hypothetical protein
VETFEQVQARLPAALMANQPGSGTDHVLVALPSYSLGESLLSHYAGRIPALEHRYLVVLLLLNRFEHCDVVFVCSRAPEPETLDYYTSLAGSDDLDRVRRRFHVLEVPGIGPRSVASKLLDRPDLLEELRRLVDGRPALIEPWNVTEAEVAVACATGIPINGTAPDLWPLGFKSAGRRVFREAAVPMPVGVEDVRSVAEVVAAVHTIRAARPEASAVIVKADDSGAGDGNVVLDLNGRWPDRLHALPDWYLRDLANGAVVEERVCGAQFSSPSAQVDICPGGEVVVLATHEQVLGGADDQIYLGCRFPANPSYAAELARHALATGHALAARGVLGRISVDFAATLDHAGRWSLHALEVNLRKGGTTHPFCALRNLVPGRYDAPTGCWRADDGSVRAYSATDNLVDPGWVGLGPAEVIAAVGREGLSFDPFSRTGVVLHMLSGLAIDGRVGLTAIGADADEAARLHSRAEAAIATAGSGVLSRGG